MRRRLALLVFSLGAVAAAGLLTTSSACATAAEREHAQRAASREQLAQLSAALAQAGMSVPVPPRVCEDATEDATEVRFDGDVGCVTAPLGASPRDVVTVYARAIVARRLPQAPIARADELARAFLDGDAAFPTLARAIESEFDLHRARDHHPQATPTPVKAKASVVVADGGVPDDAARAPAASERVAGEERDAGVANAASADIAARPPSLRERLVGTWATTKPNAIVQVHSLCADGAWRVVLEPDDDVEPGALGELSTVRGRWEVSDGEPPRITLTSANGDKKEGAVSVLTDDKAELIMAGDAKETMHLTRRAKTATCD